MENKQAIIEQLAEMIVVKIQSELWPRKINPDDPLYSLVHILAKNIAETQHEIDELKARVIKLEREAQKWQRIG